MTSPFSIDGMRPPYMWRSEPQMAQDVTLMIASRGSSIVGSGTLSQRISALPCHVMAFMGSLHIRPHQPARYKRDAVLAGASRAVSAVRPCGRPHALFRDRL